MKMQHSIITLQPGIYIVRHPSGGAPMSVGRAIGGDGCDGRIEAMFTPGTHGTLLRSAADCIVLQVFDAPAALLVTCYLEREGDLAAPLRVDKVGLEAAQTVQSPIESAASQRERVIEVAPQGITLIGHIERTGDVVAAPGTRLGEPSSGLRLEGFQVVWPDKAPGVEIVYTVSVEGQGKTQPVPTGNYCGTRREGRRITEVVFSLEGPNASKYALDGQACFSGGFQVPVQGATSLSGPSGLEHLTALELRIGASSGGVRHKTNPWENPSKTKVLKAKKRQS